MTWASTVCRGWALPIGTTRSIWRPGPNRCSRANLYGRALQELIALCEYLGDQASAQKYTAYL